MAVNLTDRPAETLATNDTPPVLIGAGLDFTSQHSPLAPWYLRTSDVLAVAMLSLLFILLSLVRLSVTEVRLHLDQGLAILQEGPSDRAFSWLFQVAVALSYRAGYWLAGPNQTLAVSGGIEFLRSLFAVLVTMRFLFLWLALRRQTRDSFLALIGLMILLLLGLGRPAVLEPVLVAEVLFAFFLFVLSREKQTLADLLLLVPGLVLWANLHESFLVGLALLGLVCLGRWWGSSEVRPLAISLGLALILIAALNPHGPGLYVQLAQLPGDTRFMDQDAWKPLRFSLQPTATVLYVLVGVAILLVPVWTHRWYSPAQLLLIAFFGIWPWWHQFALLWWVMLAPLILFSLLDHLSPRLPDSARFAPSFRKTIIASLLVLIALSWIPPIHWLLGGKPAPLDRSLVQLRRP